MNTRILLPLLVLFLAAAPVASAQSARQELPPIVSDDLGLGFDSTKLRPAESASAGIVYYVIFGSEAPTQQIADWVKKHGINKQKDGYGDEWSFDPMQPEQGWSRIGKVQLQQNGPVEGHKMIAGLHLTNYLNFKATTQASQLLLPTTGGKEEATKSKAKENSPD